MTRGDPLIHNAPIEGKRQLGQLRGGEPPDLGEVVSGTWHSDRGSCLVDREDNRFAVTGIEPDQIADDDVKTGLLARLPRRRPLNGFTALDEASWKAPLSRLAGAWSALAKQNATVARYQDRHGELGI